MDWIEESIERLLITSDGEIKSRLEEISVEFEIENTKAIGHCYCVKLDGNGNVRWKDLIDFMVDQIVDYAIPRKEIIEATKYLNEKGSTAKIIALKEKARNLFTNIQTTGEGGEMMIYLLAKEYLKIPQLLSKMSLKTSGNVHYHGVDGIHVKYDPKADSLCLYWGESKMYGELSQAITSCFESLKGFLLDTMGTGSVQERDLHLITANISSSVSDEKLEDLLVRYFDKDDELSNKVEYRGICFVGFDCSSYPTTPKSKTLDILKDEITKELNKWKKKLSSGITKHTNLELFEIHVFMIPFPSVEEFRAYFLGKMAK